MCIPQNIQKLSVDHTHIHTSGFHHWPVLDTKTGAPRLVWLKPVETQSNFTFLISRLSMLCYPITHQDGSRQGQSRCTAHERPEQRAVQSQSMVTWAPRMVGPVQCHPAMSVTPIRVRTGMCGNENHRSHAEMECSKWHLITVKAPSVFARSNILAMLKLQTSFASLSPSLLETCNCS